MQQGNDSGICVDINMIQRNVFESEAQLFVAYDMNMITRYINIYTARKRKYGNCRRRMADFPRHTNKLVLQNAPVQLCPFHLRHD